MEKENSKPATTSSEHVKEDFAHLSKEQLIELLLVALEAVKISTENALRLLHAVEQADAKVRELESEKISLEAELTVLRARP